VATALALGATGAAHAADMEPNAVGQVTMGDSQSAVRAAFGEPTRQSTYLFAAGSTDLYYIAGGSLGNEWVMQIRYDAQGRVIASQRISAGFFDLQRLD
jgi:hypothetical protein